MVVIKWRFCIHAFCICSNKKYDLIELNAAKRFVKHLHKLFVAILCEMSYFFSDEDDDGGRGGDLCVVR